MAFTDGVGRNYCALCLNEAIALAGPNIMDYLMATIPFEVGDRVEARTAGALFDGVGVIDEVSFNPAKFGTPVHPSFHVRIEDKAYPEAPDELWYTEPCLKRVNA